jgi:hypothetical protein
MNCNCGKARNNGICPHKTAGELAPPQGAIQSYQDKGPLATAASL